MPPARVLVGVIGAPHGVRGEVRVKPLTDDPLALKAYSPLDSEDGKRSLKILSARMQGDMVVARFEGVADRDAAAKLANLKLYVPRARLPEAGEGEYYAADLVGLRVEDQSGTAIGTVAGLSNFGAGDLLDIARDGREAVYVPFTGAFVPVVDIPGGRIVIAPPEGLLDDEAENLDKERG